MALTLNGQQVTPAVVNGTGRFTLKNLDPSLSYTLVMDADARGGFFDYIMSVSVSTLFNLLCTGVDLISV